MVQCYLICSAVLLNITYDVMLILFVNLFLDIKIAIDLSNDRTDLLGVPVFWHKPTADPPSSWDSWIGHFNLAITLRERFDPRELLKPPGIVHDDPVPNPKIVGPNEDAAATANRIARDKAAARRRVELNEEKRAQGP